MEEIPALFDNCYVRAFKQLNYLKRMSTRIVLSLSACLSVCVFVYLLVLSLRAKCKTCSLYFRCVLEPRNTHGIGAYDLVLSTSELKAWK